MTDYLRRSLWRFFLLFFQPTRFRREIAAAQPEGRWRRLGYGVARAAELLPWSVILTVGAVLIAGTLCDSFGIPFDWHRAWREVAFGVTASGSTVAQACAPMRRLKK
jgi:hypothetical protein